MSVSNFRQGNRPRKAAREQEPDVPLVPAEHRSVDSVEIWLMIDADGLIQGSSPAAERDLGFNPANGDTPFLDLFRGEDKKLVQHAVSVVGQGAGQPVPLEIALRLGDGSNAFWDGDLVQIGGMGAGGLILLRAHDVTRHKNSEDYLRQVVNQIREGVVVVQGDEILFANETIAALLNYQTADQIVGLGSVLKLIDSADHKIIRQNIRVRARGGAARNNYDIRSLTRDGGSIWVNVNISQIDWGSGTAALATITDITGERLVEEAKRETERLFSQVFQLSPDMISLSRLSDGDIVDVNESFLEIFGYSKEELLGRLPEDLGLWADENFYATMVGALAKKETIRRIETKGRTKSGDILNISVSASRLKYDESDLLLIVARDTTEERAQKRELQVSKEQAELASRSKSEFLANMSHELRTPLNAILGFSEVLSGEIYGPLGDEKYKEYASDIHTSGNHLLKIIGDILDLAKVEVGRIDLQEVAIPAGKILDESVRLLRARAVEAKLELEVRQPAPPLTVRLDPLRTKQIMLNLLSNAIKFSNPGGLIEVGVTRKGKGAGFEIFVADNGIGMTPEEVRLALAPFGQVGSAMTRQHEGSGLGLPLARAFTEMQDGKLLLDSEPGRGTIVRLCFPENRILP